MLPLHVIRLLRGSPGEIATSTEFRRAGFDRRQVAAWAFEGLLERLLHGVYREAGREPPRGQRLHLALRYCDQRRPGEQPPCVITGGDGLAWRLGADAMLSDHPLVLADLASRVRDRALPFTILRSDMKGVAWDDVRRLRVADVARCIADQARVPGTTDQRLRVAVDEVRNARVATAPELVRRWGTIGHSGRL